MEQEPTNRELMHFIKDIKEDVGEIKLQTIKTNKNHRGGDSSIRSTIRITMKIN